MLAAGFLWNIKDPADSPWYRQNMIYGICRQCQLSAKCPKTELYPIISPMAAYVMKYHGEIQSGFAVYPEPGGWEQQPTWFVSLLSAFRAKLQELSKTTGNKGNDGNSNK